MRVVSRNNDVRELLQAALRQFAKRRFTEAESTIRRCLAVEPENITAMMLLATILIRFPDRLDEAERLLQQVERLEPDNIALPNNYGTLAWAQGDFQTAEMHFREAVVREPGSARARVNRANCLRRLGELDEAISEYLRAIDIKPSAPEVHASLASTFEYTGRYQEALEHFTQAIRFRPDFARARYARGMLMLKLGKFDAGWRDYEWRFEAAGLDYLDQPDWGRPVWDGRPFAGKRLLVQHEQGLGDGIHFCRYLPQLKQIGGAIIFKCGPPLFRLLQSLGCVDQIISRRSLLAADDVDFDFHVPLMSLPRIFGTRLVSIPADVPYLHAEPKDVDRWAGLFDRRKLNVGLAWSGKETQPKNRERSCRLTDLAPLGDVPGVRFYSLQKNSARLQIADVFDCLQVLADHTFDLVDLAETAAFMENLDLIITVDTVTAHLAGALGRPTWTLLCKNHCWRYLLDRDDSPWYPTMTLFRQELHGDWSAPVAEVRRRLAVLAGQKQTGSTESAGDVDETSHTASGRVLANRLSGTP